MKRKCFSSLSGELQTYIIDPLNYDLIEQIGVGGFAEVWLAKDRSNGKFVAYKKIRQNFDDKMTRIFIREISTMAKADHPFLLKLLGFSTKPPMVIITEYIPNSSLFKFRHSTRKSKLLTGTARTLIAMGIAHAMNYLHSLGIIHRDLKSMNVLLDDNLLPKLCDFGVARFYDQNNYEPMTQSAGTPNWMAPEMQQNSSYGPEVDVYSFGMILYELATDDIPWKSLTPLAVVKKVVVEHLRPKLPQNLDPALKELIKMCWADNPKERPTFKEIYKMFKSGKVAFKGTDQSQVDAIAAKLKTFDESSKWSSSTKSKTKSRTSNSFVESDDEEDDARNILGNERSRVKSYMEERNGPFIDIDALSDPRSFSFKQELKRAEKDLPKLQSRQFFTIIAEYLKDGCDPGITESVLLSLQKVLQRKEPREMFISLELHKILPLQTERLIDSTIDVYQVLFENAPKVFDNWFRDSMIFLIGKRPTKAIILLSYYAKAFENLVDPWALVDLMIEKAQTFIRNGAGAELVSTLFFLCYNFDDYAKYRLKQAMHVFTKSLESQDNKVVSLSYNSLAHFFSPKIKVDYGLITEHLLIPELAPFALSLLVRINDIPALPELIKALLKSAETYQEANLCLVKIAALEEGSTYLLRKSSWMCKMLPTLDDTLRLFLAIMTHQNLRQIICRTHNAIEFLKTLSKDDGLTIFLATIIRKLEPDKKTFSEMKEEGIVKHFIRSALKNENEKTETSILFALYTLGEVGFAPEFVDYGEKLKETILENGKNAINAISVVTLLSRYGPCAAKFGELKLHKLFKKLLNDEDYKEYAEEFMENYNQF